MDFQTGTGLNHCTTKKEELNNMKKIRKFPSGAIRDSEEGKHDPEGFLSPIVIKSYCEYMHKNRIQSDGNYRASDNWQKGINRDAYIKSMWRHFLDLWLIHRGYKGRETKEDALNGILFNAMGYLYEELKK